uniref:Uncharacterized protein n=1 Tax=Oryza rufipogon TaxID=4529 RepID=A0A0E0N966_ORYRU
MPSLLRQRPSAVNEPLDMKNIDLALDKTIADLSEGGNASAEQAEEERAHDIGVQWHNDNDGGASTHSRTRYDGGRWQPA